ncbi:hypothetical protein L9Z73_02765 [Pseudomonas sp. TNT11]|uniref:Integrase n=1 Tax=Pseudomonas emilianonis TaxID=2915812 RepID=A0ABT0EC66_9PSED|nr:hypothetical protein [Pseudomonas emilianonis]MCK1783319.1 hypothetical protein [Pseudomonas emilianonis]
MSNSFIHRQVVIIDARETNVEVIHPQLAVLMVNNGADIGKRYLDIGSLCYMRRGKPLHTQVGCPVDLSSLDKSRIPFAQALIEQFSAGRISPTTAMTFHKNKKFVDWIDNQKSHYAFDDVSAMKQAYGDYTGYLLHSMNSSGISGQPIKQMTASSYQSSARKLVMLATGLSEPEVSRIATYIPRRSAQANHVNLKLPNADTQAQTFAALINYIEEAHRVLVKGDALPLHLVSPKDDLCYLYSLQPNSAKSQSAEFSTASILFKSPTFPTWEEAKAHFGLMGDSAALQNKRASYDDARQRHEKSNNNSRSWLRVRIGAHAVVAGMLVFIAATGCNLRVAQNLQVGTLKIVSSTQGKRFSGTKARAGGKTVEPEFGARFSPIFKKYLELRTWVLNGADSTLVFPVISNGYGVAPVGASSINGLKRLISRALPKTIWVTPTQWRKNVSYQYVKLSGSDMSLTAEKLGNTETTLRQSYSRPALEDYATEISHFLEAQYHSAITRTRTVELIPVRILGKKKDEIATTGTGSCEKTPESQPEHAQGFTARAPTPNCVDPESCLFCAHYAVHADKEDLRRLLSLRYLIQAIKAKQPADHWQSKFGPTVHRIDEVLSAIQDIDTSYESIINQVRDEVERGALDPFWAIHFDTLVTLGTVS